MSTEMIPRSPQQLPPLTWQAILTMISEADDALTVDLDPAVLVDAGRDKVDALRSVVSRLQNLEKYWGDEAEPLLTKKRAAAAAAKRLKDYIALHMRENGFEKVPGIKYRVQLQNAAPALELVAPSPTDGHRDLFPQYVETVIEHRWRTDKIKADLLSGALDESCPFAKIRVTRYAKFYPNTPENLPAAKKGEKA